MYSDVASRAEILHSLLSAMGTSFHSVPLRFLMATKHLALAHFCDELNRPEQAEREIQEAEKQCHDQDGIPHPYLHKFIRLCKLKIDAASIDMVDTKAIMEIAHCAAAEGFYRAEWLALGMVAAKNAALSLRQRNFAIRERQHTELCMRMENILSELGNIHQLCQTALLNHNFYDAKYCESLEWWKNFDVLHPRYNIWQHRINRQIMLSTLHVNLEDFVPALEARQRAEDLLEECKDFWKPCRLESQCETSFLASKSNAHSQSRQRRMLRKSEITQKFFFEDYENRHLTIPDPDSGQLYYGTLGVHVIGTRQAPFEALLDWLSADMQTGELMPTQLGIILGLPLGNFTIDECLRHLEHTSSRHLIALLYGPLDDPVPCERWQSTFDALRSWLDKTKSFPEIQQQFMLLEVQKTRIERSQRQAIQQIAECRRGLDMLNSIAYADDLKDNVRLLRIAWQSSFAMAVASSWLRASVWTGKMEEDFTEALVVLKQALADVQVSDPSPHAGFPGIDEFLRGVKYFALGQLYVSKFEAGGGVDSEPALASLRFAESCFRKKRRASSSKHGFTAVKRYLKALEQPMVQQIFPTAIRMQSTAHGASLHADRIWKWIQTAKCRGLGSLGRFATLDHRYTESFLNSEDDDGEGFETEDLRRLSLEAKTSVVFIDWYTNFLNAEIGVPIMLAWRAGGAVRIFKFGDDVDALDLTVYKRQFLSALERHETCEHDQTRKPAYWLQKFEGLVKPVLEISEPGDVLVFSPCGLLHGVPLHAIIFDGQPLIGRNPIT